MGAHRGEGDAADDPGPVHLLFRGDGGVQCGPDGKEGGVSGAGGKRCPLFIIDDFVSLF